jgi:hypothetical protein
MYLGKGARWVQENPNRMAAINMDCTVCHSHKQGSSALGSCKECHGELTEGMVARWKQTLKEREDGLLKQISALKTAPGEKSSTALQQTLKDAQFNYEFLKKGNGIHNIVYAMQVIDATEKALKKSNGMSQAQTTEKQSPPCMICHRGIEGKKVNFGKVTFPHEIHAEGETSCLKCHSQYADHGKTILKGCSECHHGEGAGKVQCSDCHSGKEAMFSGNGVTGLAKTPDAMWGKVNCVECHKAVKQGKKESASAIRAACIGCHDKEYGSKVDSWIAADKRIQDKYMASRAGLEKDLSALEKELGRHSVPLRAAFDEIDADIQFLLNGRFYHNPRYSDTITAKIDRQTEALRSMMKEQKAGNPIVPKR